MRCFDKLSTNGRKAKPSADEGSTGAGRCGERGLASAVIPGLTRDRSPPAPRQRKETGRSRHDVQAETLHPLDAALRPPGYFDGCLPEGDAPPMFSSLRGSTPERCAPLGGFGVGVKAGVGATEASNTLACGDETARSAARPTGRRALWRESQAARTRCARRLRAKKNRLAEPLPLRMSSPRRRPGFGFPKS